MLQGISTITKDGLSSSKKLGKRIQTIGRSLPDKPLREIQTCLKPLEQQPESRGAHSIRSDHRKLNNRYCLTTLAKTGVVVATTTAVYLFAKTIGLLPSWVIVKKEAPSTDVESRNDQSHLAIRKEDNKLDNLFSLDHESLGDLSFPERVIDNFEEIEVQDIPLSKQKRSGTEDALEIDTATLKRVKQRQLLDVPSVENPIVDQEISVGEPLSLLLNNVFSDFQTLNATLSTGAPLPSWMSLSFSVNPTFLGSTPSLVSNTAKGVAIAGNTAFVAARSNGLQIINVSDPNNPTLLSFYNTPAEAMGIAVSGSTAFVAASVSGLQIIDVSDSGNPIFLGSYDTPGTSNDVMISGTTAFVADSSLGGLQIIDVSDPSNPLFLGFYNTTGYALSIAISDTTACVADGVPGGLQIIDIRDPSTPSLLGSYDTPGHAYKVAVSGTTVFVADGDTYGLQIVDISDPSTPSLIGFYYTNSAWDVKVNGNIAFVAGYGAGLLILDVSDPSNPTLLGSYDTPGNAIGVAVRGTRAYVTDYLSPATDLQIIHIGDWLLSGTPASGDQGSFSVKITADDGLGNMIDDIFNLTVTNTVPTLDNLIPDQNTPLGSSFIYQLSSFAFSDPDGDALTYSATQSDGSALPNWLAFDPITRTFNGTPQSGDQGNYQIKVTADDGFGGSVEDVFQLNVLNHSPDAIIPLSSQLGNEGLDSIQVGQLFDFQFQEFSFIDSDGDPLTYNATQAGGAPLPGWMSFDPVNRRFTGTPQTGDQAVLAITVTADDGFGGTVSDTFVLTVTNRAPSGGAIPDQTANINQDFDYQVPPSTFTDLDGDALTYSATLSNGNPLPGWLSFDSGNQTFSGTPGLSDRGVFSVRVLANDGRATGYTDFSLEVGNVAPQVISPLSDQLLPEQETVSIGDAWNFQFSPGSFYDPDGDIPTYTATQDDGAPLPSWLAFDPNTRTFSGTPQSGDQGEYTLKVSADDGFGGLISDGFAITVANRAPMVEGSLTNQNITVGQYLSYTINTTLFSDPDGDSLSYSATLEGGSPLPGWLNFNPETKTFSGTPLSGNQETLTIVVTGQDGYGGSVENSFRIDIPNQRPIVTRQLAEQQIMIGQFFTFLLPSTLMIDPDGDSLSYTATLDDGSSLPSWLNFDDATRIFTGTPQAGDQATLAITVTADDGFGGTVADTFVLTIENRVPSGESIPNQMANINQDFDYQVPPSTFTDLDGDVLIYSAALSNGNPLPGWLSFDSGNQTFSGTPGLSDRGIFSLRVLANDGIATGYVDFSLEVANVAPQVTSPLSDQLLPEQEIVSIGDAWSFQFSTGSFYDPDGDIPTYTATQDDGSPLPSWLAFDPNTRTFSGTPQSGDQGEYTLKVSADDGFDGLISDSFAITVANRAPMVEGSLTNQNITVGQYLSYTINTTLFSDPDGDSLSYSATLEGGSPLPGWLNFNPETKTFSGTPLSGNQETLTIVVTGQDGYGGSVENSFRIDIPNQRPIITRQLAEQQIMIGQFFTFLLPSTLIIDPDGDSLSYTATLDDGSPLPSWLNFDDATRIFTGTPQTGDQATLAITVTADDGFGGTVADTFVLTIENRVPSGESIPNQTANINQDFDYRVPPSTFTDLDGDVLTYSATLSNGNPLPGWLSFDSGNQTFSGTPGLSDRGVFSVRVLANDGIATGYVDFSLEVANVVPQVTSPLSDQLLPEQETVSIGDAWSFQFSTGSFYDPDGDIPSYTATQDDGSALPSWLAFDPNTRTFSGTPQSGDQGEYTLKVTADDGFSGLISDSFAITVANQAPIVEGSLTNQNITVGQYLSYTINTTLFSDPDGDSLSYSATLEGGTPLPGWLNFNPQTKTFSGTPLSGNQETLTIVVTGQDGHGGSVENSFRIDIPNQRPIVTRQLVEQRIAAGQSFSFPLPGSLIIDPDGDNLRYVATLSDGSPLPDWLNFDDSSRTFTGNPESPETLAIKITAEDPYGERAETTFDLRILGGVGGNISPTLTLPIQDQQADIGASFTFTFDSQTFTDGNGDVLSYEASLENGDPLPSWLNFDAVDRTFRGTPTKEDLGEITVLVTASDPQKLTAIDTFTITIVDTTNYAPVVINPLSQQTADVGKEFRFTVPDTTFNDPNGETLRYSVLSLPHWLHFDPDTRTFSGTPRRGDTNTYANRDYVIELMASDGQLTTSTPFIVSVAGASYWELAIKIGTPLASALFSAFGFYKKRGMFINPFRKNIYQKPAETALIGETYQRTLSVPSGEIERVMATIADKRGKMRNLPGGELPGWLTYNHDSNMLFGKPRDKDTGAITIHVLGVAGIIKEQFVLTVRGQEDFFTGDNLEMQPMKDYRSEDSNSPAPFVRDM